MKSICQHTNRVRGQVGCFDFEYRVRPGTVVGDSEGHTRQDASGRAMIIRAFIPSYKSVEISGRHKKFHTYRLEVHCNDDVSYLDKRYSDFLQLHKEIRRKFGRSTPFFPPKKVRNSTVKVLESRRTGLELYIQTVLAFTPVPPELLGFLNIHHHSNYNFDDKHNTWTGDDAYNNIERGVLNQPAAGFVEDPFVESDTSSNISDTVTRGVFDALYNV